MHRSRCVPLLLGAALALAVAGCATRGDGPGHDADAPRALPAQGPVDVSWADPATFGEARVEAGHPTAPRSDWVRELARYLRRQAERRLPPGDTLQLAILDARRAGGYEPWLGPDLQDTRIVRDLYPPRMTLRFRQSDASGKVVAEGERRLVDPAFLQHASPADSDPLRYEKGMIDAWLRREFPANRAGG